MYALKSSLEVAVEAAARVDSKLAKKGAIKPNPIVVAFKKAGKSVDEIFSTEFEINEFPVSIRNLLTKTITQEEIHCFSGATIATRGRFIPLENLGKPKYRGEKPLHLAIQGPNKQSIDLALQRIETLIADTTMDTSQPKYREKVLIGLESAPASFDVRGKVMGPGGANLQYINNETGAIVTVRGRGSGFLEPGTNQESIEPLHICVEHSKYEVLQAGRQLAFNLIETVQQEWVNLQQQQQAALQQPMTIQLQQPYNPVTQPNQLIVNGAGEMGGMVTLPVFSQQAMGQIVSVPPPSITVPPPTVHIPQQQQPLQIGLAQGQQNLSSLVQGPPPQIQQQQLALQQQQMATAAAQGIAAGQIQSAGSGQQQQQQVSQAVATSQPQQQQQHQAPQQQLTVTSTASQQTSQQQGGLAGSGPGQQSQQQHQQQGVGNNAAQQQQPGHDQQQTLVPQQQLLPLQGQQVFVSGGTPILTQPQLQQMHASSLVQPQIVQASYPLQYMQTSSGQMVVGAAYPGAGGGARGGDGSGSTAPGGEVMVVQYQGQAGTRTSRLGSQLLQVVNPQTGQVVPTQVVVPPPGLVSPQQLAFLQPHQQQMLVAQPQQSAPQLQQQLGVTPVQHVQLQGLATTTQVQQATQQQHLQALKQQLQQQLQQLQQQQQLQSVGGTQQLQIAQLQQLQQQMQQSHLQQQHQLQQQQLQQQQQTQLAGVVQGQQMVGGTAQQQNLVQQQQAVAQQHQQQQAVAQQHQQQQGVAPQHQQQQTVAQQQQQSVAQQQQQNVVQAQQQPPQGVPTPVPPPPTSTPAQQVIPRHPPPHGQKRRFEGEQNQLQNIPPQPVPPPSGIQNRKGVGDEAERKAGQVAGSGGPGNPGIGGGAKLQNSQDEWKEDGTSQDRQQNKNDVKPDPAKRGRPSHPGELEEGSSRLGVGGKQQEQQVGVSEQAKVTFNHYSSKPQMYNAQLPFHLQAYSAPPPPPPPPQQQQQQQAQQQHQYHPPQYYQQPPHQHYAYSPWIMPPQ